MRLAFGTFLGMPDPMVFMGDREFLGPRMRSKNVKALAAIKATSKEKDLKAKVTGTIKEEVIQVESIQIE